jgi:hypothetical protein
LYFLIVFECVLRFSISQVVISKLPAFSAYASRIVPTKESLQILNINQTITALAVGRFSTDSPTDFLFIGTPTELIVYDVPRNREVFRKSVGQNNWSYCD